MSPPRAGTASFALLLAAQALKIERAKSGQGATLMELVQRSQVGYRSARLLVPQMRRLGLLKIKGERKVDYRNRPVKEYEPAAPITTEAVGGWADLGHCLQGWGR